MSPKNTKPTLSVTQKRKETRQVKADDDAIFENVHKIKQRRPKVSTTSKQASVASAAELKQKAIKSALRKASASRSKLDNKKPKAQKISPNIEGQLDTAPLSGRIIHQVNVTAPCRSFKVEFKVSNTQSMSLTLEFLLRSLKIFGTLNEDEISRLFHYNTRETQYVIKEAFDEGLITWEQNSIKLSTQAQKLFENKSTVPKTLNVETLEIHVAFDQIAFDLAQPEGSSFFETKLHELSSINDEYISNGSQYVPEAFKKNYYQIMSEDRRLNKQKKGLYSVGHVEPKNRFLKTLTINVSEDFQNVGQPDFEIFDQRLESTVNQNRPIAEAIAQYLKTLCMTRKKAHHQSIKTFAALFSTEENPITLDLKASATKIFEKLQAHFEQNDQYTVFFGSPLLEENIKTFIVDIKKGTTKNTPRGILKWLTPNTNVWGCTTLLPNLLNTIQQEYEHAKERSDQKLTTEVYDTYNDYNALSKAIFSQEPTVFNKIRMNDNILEIIMYEGIAALVCLHLPPSKGTSIPHPIGISVTDERVLSVITKYFEILKNR